MNISVFKDSKEYLKIDLAKDIAENGGADISFFIGRSDDCHVVLDDMKVSRQHAELKYQNQSWMLVSCNEFNALSINGSLSQEVVLKNGDLVSIGPFSLSFELSESTGIDSSANSELLENEAVNEMTTTMMAEATSDGATETMMENAPTVEATETVALEQGSGEEVFEVEGEAEEAENNVDEGLDGDLGGEFSEESESDSNEFDTSEEDEFSDVSSEFDDDGTEGDEFSDSDNTKEEGFDESGFSDENDFPVEASDDMGDDEKTRVLNTFAKFELELFGEYAPYDKFVIENGEIIIGREPDKCQIVLNDPEVSSTHAIIKKNNITCTLEDLKSGNGTLLNGERINSHELTNNDEFIIGSTTFTVKIQSDFLAQESERLMPVEENQIVEVEEIVEVGTNFDDEDGAVIDGESLGESGLSSGNQSLFSKEALKDPEKRKKLLIIGVVLVALWVLLDDGGGGKKKVAKIKPKQGKAKEAALKKEEKLKVKLTQEQKEFVDSTYILAKDLFNSGKYRDTLTELDRIHQIIPPGYKKSKFMEQLTKEALKEEERLAEEARKKKENELKKIKIEKLVKQTMEAFTKENIELAESLMTQVAVLDPDNQDIAELKLRIDAHKKKKEREALEKAQREAERKRQENALTPGKTFYLKKEWYKAILKLEEFLRQSGIDEDLIKEATQMLTESKSKLSAIVDPLTGKARSLKEGQDLKGAYENYLEVISYDPSHEEALNEMDAIRERLELRSKKAYREAIIAESLSLFDDAKEKFQEVQQISPTDSEYYKKATEKLKEYLD